VAVKLARAIELFERLVAGGAEEINALIGRGETEELFLDYKRSADNGGGVALHARDRENFSKAISGFGNGEGGILIWGVACKPDLERGDIPTHIVPIINPNRFKSWLENVSGGLTVPPHSGIRHHSIVISDNAGVVVSLIPSGNHPPYQTVGSFSYYMRAGSNFARVPHAILSGMFGRRPQPFAAPNFVLHPPVIEQGSAVRSDLTIVIVNFGKGVAEDIFLNLLVTKKLGPNCSIALEPVEQVWDGRFAYGAMLNLISKRKFRLAPEAQVSAVNIRIVLDLPFDEGFSYQGTCGATGSETFRFTLEREAQTIEQAYRRVLANPDDAECADGLRTLWAPSLPSLPYDIATK